MSANMNNNVNSNANAHEIDDEPDDTPSIEEMTRALEMDDDTVPFESANTSTNPSPAAVKNKTPNKSVLGKMRASRVASSTTSSNRNTNVGTSQIQPVDQSQAAARRQMPVVGQVTNPGNNQMMGGIANTPAGGFQVQGTNIGSRATEPEWSQAQLQAIADAGSTRLTTLVMAETRRSHPDPAGQYLVVGDKGTIVTKPAAFLPNIGTDKYQLGLGKVKPDEKTGKSKLYSDVVMKGPNWVLNQWTSRDVIVEGVPDNILDKPPRMVGIRPERRIGHDFARIGLPKLSFAPMLETLRSSMPSILESVSVTKGYYWVNASWGVTGSPGGFVYLAGGTKQSTFKLYEAMKMLSGSSSMGVGTVAISIASESKQENGRMIPNPGKYDLSVKIHNMFHIKKVDYHSPPQASSTGFEIPDDIMSSAESLDSVSNLGSVLGATSSAFASGGINPFHNVTASMGVNSATGAGQHNILL